MLEKFQDKRTLKVNMGTARIVLWQAEARPMVPVPHMDISSCLSCPTSYPVSTGGLGKQQRRAHVRDP